MKDNLQWKRTFNEGQPLMENYYAIKERPENQGTKQEFDSEKHSFKKNSLLIILDFSILSLHRTRVKLSSVPKNVYGTWYIPK